MVHRSFYLNSQHPSNAIENSTVRFKIWNIPLHIGAEPDQLGEVAPVASVHVRVRGVSVVE